MTISLNPKPFSTTTYDAQQLFPPPFRHLSTSLRSSHSSLMESFPYQWVRQPGIPWFFPSKLPPTHTNQLTSDRSCIYHGDLGEMQSRGGKLQVEPGPALVFAHPKSYHFPSFNEAQSWSPSHTWASSDNLGKPISLLVFFIIFVFLFFSVVYVCFISLLFCLFMLGWFALVFCLVQVFYFVLFFIFMCFVVFFAFYCFLFLLS